jgi:UDP-GlcNAc:undecaprenyl-phosphate GlcNAc-1-phosphate transferase
MNGTVAVAVAGASAAALTPAAAALARRVGVLDWPGELKVHSQAVPYLGGLGVLAGLGPVVAFTRPAFVLPIMLAVLLGLADDVREVPARVRLVCEILIGVVAALLLDTANVAAGLAVVALVVLLVNAVNMLDGLDALAGSVALVGAVGFAIVLSGPNRGVALGGAAALAGFLLWNRPPARIYLGDSGSYLVGVTLALLLSSAIVDEPGATSIASLLFVGVPVGDAVIAVVRRARNGAPLFTGDRAHVYDQLVDRGLPAATVTIACAAAQALLVAAGITAAGFELGSASWVVGVVIVSCGAAALWQFARVTR